MLPADTHEMACSLLRPPKTTATRTRVAVAMSWQSQPGEATGVGHACVGRLWPPSLAVLLFGGALPAPHSGLVLRPSSSAIASSTESPL